MSDARKLAAIMVGDVVGYSRLAGADEDRTLARLRGLHSDLIDPAVAAHQGRIVKRTGNGSTIERRSVVDAVRCAIEVQTGLSQVSGEHENAVSDSQYSRTSHSMCDAPFPRPETQGLDRRPFSRGGSFAVASGDVHPAAAWTLPIHMKSSRLLLNRETEYAVIAMFGDPVANQAPCAVPD